MAKNRANPGLFNFQNLMNEFYKYDTKDDPDAAAMKNAFQGNAIQSVFDTQQAKELAYANQEIASNAMNQASSLEQRNMAQVMKDEFVYGMTKMGQEYDFQSRFAVDEANRTLNQTAMQGNVDMNKTTNEYSEDRATQLGDSYTKTGTGTIEAEADQERRTKIGEETDYKNKGIIGATAEEGRRTDLANLVGEIGNTAEAKKKGKIAIEAEQERKTDIGQEYIDQNKGRIGAKGTEDRKTISLTSEEGREDKRLDARLKAKDRSDQSDYARNLAGKF